MNSSKYITSEFVTLMLIGIGKIHGHEGDFQKAYMYAEKAQLN